MKTRREYNKLSRGRIKREGTMNKKLFLIAAVLLAASMISFSQEELFYWPTCASPQNISPMQLAGGRELYARCSAAWNGKDFAVAWCDNSDQRPHFRRFFADGTPAGPESVISTTMTYVSFTPNIVWNGSGYGITWLAFSGSSYYQAYFAKLDANGNVIAGPTKVSFYGKPETSHCENSDIAWSGSGYCVVWHDSRNGSHDVFVTLLDSNGAITYSDMPVSTAANNQDYPRIVWSSGSGRYQIVWSDTRVSGKSEIYGSQVSTAGAVMYTAALVSGTGFSYYPAVVDTGNGLSIVWEDTRDTNHEIYFARLSQYGSKTGTDLNVSSNSGGSYYPALAWTGAEYGIFWMDNRSGENQTWFQRVSPSGTIQGSNFQVSYLSRMEFPGAAFAKYGYLGTGVISGWENYVSVWGCSSDTTPPSCPESPMAYSITGTGATVSWLPSIEDYSDIAYYILYRNNTEIAKTSSNYYADTGLSLGTTYKYDVRAVNTVGLTTTGCPSASMYLKTNATLTLMLDKSDPDAHLYWNDEGMNNYNIFRGTDPQTMSLVGSTSGLTHDDTNVLLDNVNYFYTVDDPGQ
jgi:hypothetical protein